MDTTLPVTNKTATDELQQKIEQLDLRLSEVENKLSGVNVTAPVVQPESTSLHRVREQPTEFDSSKEKILTDMELSNLLNVSNLLIRDYRVYGKKPRGSYLAKVLTEYWEIKGEGWVRKNTTLTRTNCDD